jgi:hypothetical protein
MPIVPHGPARPAAAASPRDVARSNRVARVPKRLHALSAGWSIELAGLPRIIGRAVDVTERLKCYIDVAPHLIDGQGQRLSRALADIRGHLSGARG